MGLEGMTSGYDVFNNDLSHGGIDKQTVLKLVQSLADAEGRLSLSQMTVDRLVKEKTKLSGLLLT